MGVLDLSSLVGSRHDGMHTSLTRWAAQGLLLTTSRVTAVTTSRHGTPWKGVARGSGPIAEGLDVPESLVTASPAAATRGL